VRRGFNYDARIEGESVCILVPHHASNKGQHGQSWEMPVTYTLEVLVDVTRMRGCKMARPTRR